ncbi:MAG TPA: serine acetyltransferase [Verrucomicrobiales bacterium]|nr:serine acetyltransferase [Verrucomicrobiales bacterium]HRK13194.1 hypothetical protein [Prosthecobacter sp.]
MTFEDLHSFIRADLFRYERAAGWQGFARTFLREPGFRLTCLLRACRHLRARALPRWTVYPFLKLWLGRISSRLGVYVCHSTDIGPGFYIPHPCGIVINRRCRIGANCNIAQHVTLGLKSREPRMGCPVIGDRVYIGPGAVIIGAITVGSDSAVGANCVVTKDVPAHAVVAGVPGQVISMRGSEGYINDCLPGTADT